MFIKRIVLYCVCICVCVNMYLSDGACVCKCVWYILFYYAHQLNSKETKNKWRNFWNECTKKMVHQFLLVDASQNHQILIIKIITLFIALIFNFNGVLIKIISSIYFFLWGDFRVTTFLNKKTLLLFIPFTFSSIKNSLNFN